MLFKIIKAQECGENVLKICYIYALKQIVWEQNLNYFGKMCLSKNIENFKNPLNFHLSKDWMNSFDAQNV